MLYLKNFRFPDEASEMDFIGAGTKRAGYPDSIYPFKLLSQKPLSGLDFAPITVLYGSNGSGKSTALNVIAEKLKLRRESLFNYTPWYTDYLSMCRYGLYDLHGELPSESRIVTSDDVFAFLMDCRAVNQGVDTSRQRLYQDYYQTKKTEYRMASMEDYDELKRRHEINSGTVSDYIRRRTPEAFVSRSNGESAFGYFTRLIKENALYLLDEPENSMSPVMQSELADFIADSVRFYGCQFIISTHSPFLLAIKGAKIYDLDSSPVCVKKWTELENVKVYKSFFKSHEEEFGKN